ncbi:type II toxin-antitoxin system VapC family toxin [Methyloglobulus sp.]|uniref:type II toxin-antitoxin system VapC family toxin n=1 Tax=Methyloglobulus sp. TaxID=2518622 RepID=UPI0018079F65|nr:type II toxin-antitoxin system VapC family toxin [Methyloglobulus sp.]
MSYLLDTCVISECVKKNPDVDVVTWMNQQQVANLFLSAVSIAEIKKGIYKIKPSQPQKSVLLQNWLNAIELEFPQRILPLSSDVLEQWARLSAQTEMQGKKLAVMDSLIAATASSYGLALVTRNTEDFKHCGLKLLNPFSNSSSK